MTVPVDILGLFLDQGSGSSIVLLGQTEDAVLLGQTEEAVLLGQTDEGNRVLPIFIGPAEAQSIALGMQGVELPRPGTHDLMVKVIELMNGRLERVVITALDEGAFLAELVIDTPGGIVLVDSRPSDGIALAVRLGTPILVARTVFEEAAVVIEHDPDQPFDQDEIEQIVGEFERFIETAKPSDFALDNGDPEQDASDEPGDT